MSPPDHPAGEHLPELTPSPEQRVERIAEIAGLPTKLRMTVAGLDNSELDTKYKNWTVRQIVHHLADSHMNAFVRFRLALTEDTPTIKPYDENRWAELADTKTADVGLSVKVLEGLHARWAVLLRSLLSFSLPGCDSALFSQEFHQGPRVSCVCRLQGRDVLLARLTRVHKVRGSAPRKVPFAKLLQQEVCRQSRVAPVAIGEGVNARQAVMEARGNFIGRHIAREDLGLHVLHQISHGDRHIMERDADVLAAGSERTLNQCRSG